jgi:hypothetical protein
MGSGEITVAARVISNGDATGFPRVIEFASGGGGGGGWTLEYDNPPPAGSGSLGISVDGAGKNFTGNYDLRGGPHDCILSWEEGGTGDIIINGKDEFTSAVTGTFPGGAEIISLGNWSRTDTTTSRRWIGEIEYVYVWDRKLSYEEMLRVNLDPYLLVRRRLMLVSVMDDITGVVDTISPTIDYPAMHSIPGIGAFNVA